MPPSGTGYEVVSAALTSTTPVTVSAPAGKAVVSWFAVYDDGSLAQGFEVNVGLQSSGGYNAKPTITAGKITAVEFTNPHPGALRVYIVCVSG